MFIIFFNFIYILNFLIKYSLKFTINFLFLSLIFLLIKLYNCCYIFMNYNFFKNRFNYIFNGCYFLMSDLLLLPDESTYYFFLFFYDFYFFCYLFFFEFLINFFVFTFFFIFILFYSFFKFLICGKFFFYLLFYVFFVFILIFDFLFLFIFIFLIIFSFILFDKFFKIPIAGLVFLSKDFLTIEDEDLWISSNIFHLDHKIIQSDALNISLKVQEIDVFFSLITLFFDLQKINRDYFQYTLDLNVIKKNKDLKKYFRKSKFKNKSVFNFSKELDKLRLQQNVNQSDLNTADYPKNLFGFYKNFFRSIGISYITTFHLDRKKKLLKQKQFKKRNLNFLNLRKVNSIVFQKSDLSKDSYVFSQNENLTNDLILLKILRSYKNSNEKNKLFLSNLNDKKLRQNSRFLNFFWFSFPFYLYNISYSVSLINSIILRHSFFLKKFFHKFFYFFYSFIFPSNNPSAYIRKTFFNFRDFSMFGEKNLNLNFNKLLDSYLFILLSEKENQLEGEIENLDLEEFPEPSGNIFGFLDNKKLTKKQSESLKKKRKTKRYYTRFFRKLNTSELIRFNSKKNSKIVNEYNSVLYKKYPNLKVLDLYKILEYFYFVITNDVDFYEGVTFAAKVAVLRDKYGQAIVSDLLSKEDHKQSANVSVQMHYMEREIPHIMNLYQYQEPKSSGSEHLSQDNISSSISDLSEKIEMRKKFKYNATTFSSNISHFSKNLLLSYRYRFRI